MLHNKRKTFTGEAGRKINNYVSPAVQWPIFKTKPNTKSNISVFELNQIKYQINLLGSNFNQIKYIIKYFDVSERISKIICLTK